MVMSMMKDRYRRELHVGDVVLFGMATSGGIAFGRVSETQLFNNGRKPYGNKVRIIQLERKSLPRRWVAERLLVKAEESLLAAVRLIGTRPIFSDQEVK